MKKFVTIWFPAIALVVAISLMAQSQIFAGGDTENLSQSKQLNPDTTYRTAMMRGILDGKTFVGQMGDEGKTAGVKETIIFRNGMIESSVADSLGHIAVIPYTATREGDAIRFKASSTETKPIESPMRSGTDNTTPSNTYTSEMGASGTSSSSENISGAQAQVTPNGSDKAMSANPNMKWEWNGTVRGDVFEAQAKLTDAAGNTTTMWARAMLQKASTGTGTPTPDKDN